MIGNWSDRDKKPSVIWGPLALEELFYTDEYWIISTSYPSWQEVDLTNTEYDGAQFSSFEGIPRWWDVDCGKLLGGRLWLRSGLAEGLKGIYPSSS